MNKKKILILLLLVAGIVYSNSLMAGFVQDDYALIVNKQAYFSHPVTVVRILTSSDAPLGGKNPYYRPVNTFSYMLDHYFWGLHPFWYHLENLLIHCGVVVLFYLLLLEVFGKQRLAFFAAILFAVWPANVESVDWVSARNTLFCAFFSMASLLFLAKGGAKWIWLSFLTYFLALLSKEPAAAVPLFLVSYALTRAKSAWRGYPEKIKIKKAMAFAGFFVATAVYFLIRHLVLGAFTSNAGIGLSLSRLELISSVYFENFRLMIFPFKLNADYTRRWLFFDWAKAAGAVLGILLLVYFSLAKRTPEPVRAGAQWVFWGLLPVSGIIKIPSAAVAERYQYTFLFGFVLILGYCLARLQERKALTGAVIAFALVLALGVTAFKRNFVWRNDMSLYSSMIQADPGNAKAHCNLGTVYAQLGDDGFAIGEFKAALAYDPKLVQARLNLGMAYANEEHYRKAAVEFETALKLDPGNAPAMTYLNRLESHGDTSEK